MAAKIFISYRRSDSAPYALSVSQYLERAFGARNVYIDIDRMRAGQKFPQVLEQRLAECKVMVAVIGPAWLEARDDDGRRRLDDPADWVRLEIVRALARNITVIPVLVGGAALPKKGELPEELRPLLDYQAVAITTNGFRSDMAGLLKDIRAIPTPSPWRQQIVAGLAAVAILGAGAWGAAYLLGPPGSGPGTPPRPTEQPRTPVETTRQDETTRQPPLKARIATSTDRAELVDLMAQNAAERPAIGARLGALGYVLAATSTSGERWLKAGAGKEEAEHFKDCGANETWCPDMVVAPAGRFMMGSPAGETGHQNDEEPQHIVTFLVPFAVSKFAVTFAEWDACVDDRGCNGYKPEDQGWGRGRQPVINVSWNDAKTYVDWLSKKTGKSYRLLSEAEREYVTLAGTTTPFWWGPSISTSQANYDGNFTYDGGAKGEYRQKTVPVDSFAANPWGLYQVHGNVWEWVEDCYQGNYNGAPSDGSARSLSNCASRVLRGGSWDDIPHYLRSANRGRLHPDFRDGNVGFRVARTL